MADPFKSAIRNTMKQVRSNLSLTYGTASSKQICTRIRALEEYRYAKRIALYHSVNGEIDLSAIWESAPLQGKFCYFPVLQEDLSLLFLPATPVTVFKKNKYGIPEPDVSPDLAIDPDELDLIFIPLVAFDARCNRLGMGAGCYDRTLANKKRCKLFGVGYQFQRIDFIEANSWDIPLNAVITQRAVYWRDAMA